MKYLSAALAVVGFATAHNDITLNRVTGIDKYIEKVGADNYSITDVTITDHQDVYYTGPVQIGTPAQNFDVVYDTGSYNLVVAEKGCTSCKAANSYDKAASSTMTQTDHNQYLLGYGSALLLAERVHDKACFNGLCTADSYLLHPFTYESGLDLDGIMGLSPSPLTVFAHLSSAGSIDKPIFGIALGKSDEVSQVRFGGVDSTFMDDPSAPFEYAPLVNTDYWTVGYTGLKIGTQDIFGTGATTAIVDSGTTVALLTTDQTNAVIASLKANTTGLTVQSNGIAFYPGPCPTSGAEDVTVSIAGENGATIDVAIPADQYFELIQGECVLRIMGSPQLVILGDVFMRNVYSVFDQGNSKVGFKKAKAVKKA